MRTQLVTLAAAAALGLTGVAVAGPVLATTVGTEAAAGVTSRVDRITQALAGLVTDGTIDQAQADLVAQTLAESGLGGHGGPGRGGPGLEAAATALGITEAELRTALHGGATLAQVAAGEGVGVDTLVAALVEAERTRVAQAVADGRITQAQADERLADVTERVTERVNSTMPSRPDHGHGPGRGANAPAEAPADAPAETPAPTS